MKKRYFYFLMILLACVLGIGSRKYSESIPFFLAEYAGDTAWALAAYFTIRLIFLKLSILSSALAAFLISVLVEISQLYHAPWIDSFRQTVIGGLLFGFGFKWTDFGCYFIGILIGLILDLIFISKN